MGFKGSEGLELGGGRLVSLNGPLLWVLPPRPVDSSSPSPRPRSRQGQRDVWVGLAATGQELHGPRVSVNHRAGQMPGPELGQPFPLCLPFPAWPAVCKLLTRPAAELGSVRALSFRAPPPPSCLSCPSHSPHLLPVSPAFFPGARAEDLGETEGRGGPGPFLPKAASWTAQERAVPPPGGRRGFGTGQQPRKVAGNRTDVAQGPALALPLCQEAAAGPPAPSEGDGWWALSLVRP